MSARRPAQFTECPDAGDGRREHAPGEEGIHGLRTGELSVRHALRIQVCCQSVDDGTVHAAAFGQDRRLRLFGRFLEGRAVGCWPVVGNEILTAIGGTWRTVRLSS